MADKPESTKGKSVGAKKGGRKKTSVSLQEAVEGSVAAEHVVEETGEGVVQPAKGGNVRGSEVTMFLRQLVMLLEAGTPIMKALHTLSKRGVRAPIRSLITDIAQYVESGNPLWQSFDRHPRYFDTIFVNLIKASEASGTLAPVLKRMIQYREERELMFKRVRVAMIYPTVLIAACFAVMLFLTNVVVPVFKELFERIDIELPMITHMFLFWSEVIGAFWWLPILVVAALVAVYKLWYVQNPVRRMKADKIKLKLPIIGRIIHGSAIVEMNRTMSMLLRSGLSMMNTLDLTRKSIHNRAVAQSLQSMRDSVEGGGSLEEAMRKHTDVLPDVVIDMYATGEETGRVDMVAEQLADIYEEDVRLAVDGLGEAFQPVVTLVIGAIVGLLFVSLFLPLITMIESITNSGL